jgi:hypothetical protein
VNGQRRPGSLLACLKSGVSAEEIAAAALPGFAGDGIIRITCPPSGGTLSGGAHTITGDYDSPIDPSYQALIVWIDCDFAIILCSSATFDNTTMTWTADFPTDLSACDGQSATLNVFVFPFGPSDSKPISGLTGGAPCP